MRIAAVDVTALGSTPVLGLISLLAAILMILLRRWREALLIAAGIAGGVEIGQVLKHGFSRERPDVLYHAVEAHNSSFPSGHAMASTAVFLILAIVVARLTPDRTTRAVVLVAALACALLVGLSRIYLGVHWTSDVVAGWSVGAAWALACGLATLPRQARQASSLSIATPAPACRATNRPAG
ncbi:hypothetical protein BH10PSE4_BH10PSE4_16740 [soil metagenome]